VPRPTGVSGTAAHAAIGEVAAIGASAERCRRSDGTG